MKTVIYLIRHGESLGNYNKECLGHTDKDLTELGHEQARRTATELSSVLLDEIYSSDLIRAYNTALPHAEIRSMKITTTPLLRELYFGEWEGMRVEDIRNNYGDMFSVGWRRGFGTFTPPGGEYIQDCAERVYNELVRIGGLHLGGNVLVVSHAAAIRALWGKINRLAPEEVCEAYQFPENASYSVIEFEDGELHPVSYSNSAHLVF